MPANLRFAKKTPVLVTMLVCSMLCCAQAGSHASEPRPVDVATALSWLPVDTESVLVADVHGGSFLTARTFKRGAGNNKKNPVLAVDEIAALFESLPLSFIGTKSSSLEKLLDHHHLVLALEGSRHFRPPHGLGEMTFEGCEIAVFSDNLGQAGDLQARFAKGALRREEIEGHSASVFEEKLEEDIWTIYVVFPEQNVLLMASNRDYLQQVLRRMQTSFSDRALPDSLPEWKYVNRQVPFWGLRHYDKSQASFDPSSPFGGSKAANEPDEGAIGLVLNYDPTHGRVATITYMTGNKNKLGIVERAFRTRDKSRQEPEAADLQATAREIEPGVQEFSLRLSKSDSISYFFFVLEGLMGHATYL